MASSITQTPQKIIKLAPNDYPEDYGRCEITLNRFTEGIKKSILKDESEDLLILSTIGITELDTQAKTDFKDIILYLFCKDFPKLTKKQRVLIEMILSLLQCAESPDEALKETIEILYPMGSSTNNCFVVRQCTQLQRLRDRLQKRQGPEDQQKQLESKKSKPNRNVDLKKFCNDDDKLVAAFEANIVPFFSLTSILRKFADPQNATISSISPTMSRHDTDKHPIKNINVHFSKPLFVQVHEERDRTYTYIKVTDFDSQAIFDAIKEALRLPNMQFSKKLNIKQLRKYNIWKPLHGSKPVIAKMDKLGKNGPYLAVIDSVKIIPVKGKWKAKAYSSVLYSESENSPITFIYLNNGKQVSRQLLNN